ncbi:MAG: hypothetical protein ABIP49_04610 [Lysobacterales bacterium]
MSEPSIAANDRELMRSMFEHREVRVLRIPVVCEKRRAPESHGAIPANVRGAMVLVTFDETKVTRSPQASETLLIYRLGRR